MGNLGTAALKDVGTGAGQIPDMSAWTGSFGASEAAGTWYKMPNGIIVQEGSLSEFWLGSTNGTGNWSNGDLIHWRLEGI